MLQAVVPATPEAIKGMGGEPVALLIYAIGIGVAFISSVVKQFFDSAERKRTRAWDLEDRAAVAKKAQDAINNQAEIIQNALDIHSQKTEQTASLLKLHDEWEKEREMEQAQQRSSLVLQLTAQTTAINQVHDLTNSGMVAIKDGKAAALRANANSLRAFATALRVIHEIRKTESDKQFMESAETAAHVASGAAEEAEADALAQKAAMGLSPIPPIPMKPPNDT